MLSGSDSNSYWVLRHVAAFVRPGARFAPTSSLSGYENQLVFRNTDGSLIVVIQNDLSEAMRVNLLLGGRVLRSDLPADSFSSAVIPAGV